MRRYGSAFTSRGFTLVELLVVVAIITVLVALLLPALSGAREHANRIKCLSTLRSMGQAAQMHADSTSEDGDLDEERVELWRRWLVSCVVNLWDKC